MIYFHLNPTAQNLKSKYSILLRRMFRYVVLKWGPFWPNFVVFLDVEFFFIKMIWFWRQTSEWMNVEHWQNDSYGYSEGNLPFIQKKSLMAWATDSSGPAVMSGRRPAAWTSCLSLFLSAPDSRKATFQPFVDRDVVRKLSNNTRELDVLTDGMWNCTYRRVLNNQDGSVSATIVAWKKQYLLHIFRLYL